MERMHYLTQTRLWRLLFSPAPETYPAHAFYLALSQEARNPFFYSDAHVPDTIDGRFDLTVVHLFLGLERLKREPNTEAFQRALLECFFSSLDRSLRELGVGDLGVGKRIRKMADACHGRLTRYRADWADASTRRAALVANVYRGDEARAALGIDALLARLAAYEAALAAGPNPVIAYHTAQAA
ncbi:MAG: ubiquinol-cytochrome C chaperone [Alphaproteobacteria bacterium]|nr:ubiquinol-cytochrome C chaperone [Alphaproteobacteria bacterium]